MVERRTQEGMAAPIPETKINVLETTLAELGIDTSSDNLSLASDRFTLGAKKVGEDTVFVGRLNHPLGGGHFAQFLNRVSPFGDQDVAGIIDDVDLPIRAKHDEKAGREMLTSESIRLHERHLNDPRVGPAYIRFAEDHVDPWFKALKINTGLRVFETLERIRFVNGKDDLRKELFSEDGSLRKPLGEAHAEVDFCRNINNALLKYDYKTFIDFWKKGLRGIELSQAFLNIDILTTKTEQEKFAIVYFNDMGKIIADLETHRVIRDDVGDHTGKVKVKFHSNGRDVIVGNNTGTKVVVSPTGQNSKRFSWKAIKYQFPEGYKKSSLYPVIAWKKDGNGTREFLTQQEAMPYVEELGLPEGEKGDTKLGEIAVAYFARGIIKHWPAKMKLEPLEGVKGFREDGFEQPMRGGQMPAWVAIESHKGQLLKSETSVLAILEHYSNVQIGFPYQFSSF